MDLNHVKFLVGKEAEDPGENLAREVLEGNA
jgi:hypothetical protein